MVFKRRAKTVDQDRRVSRELVERVLRTQRIQEEAVQANIRQLNQGQEALQA